MDCNESAACSTPTPTANSTSSVTWTSRAPPHVSDCAAAPKTAGRHAALRESLPRFTAPRNSPQIVRRCTRGCAASHRPRRAVPRSSGHLERDRLAARSRSRCSPASPGPGRRARTCSLTRRCRPCALAAGSHLTDVASTDSTPSSRGSPASWISRHRDRPRRGFH